MASHSHHGRVPIGSGSHRFAGCVDLGAAHAQRRAAEPLGGQGPLRVHAWGSCSGAAGMLPRRADVNRGHDRGACEGLSHGCQWNLLRCLEHWAMKEGWMIFPAFVLPSMLNLYLIIFAANCQEKGFGTSRILQIRAAGGCRRLRAHPATPLSSKDGASDRGEAQK